MGTKLGLSVLWKRDSALRVSLTNLELLKSPPRRRRVNFGKKRSFLKKKSKKNPIPSHTEKSFTISILKKKKSPNIQKTTEKYLLLDTQFVFLDIIQQFRIYNLLFHKCSPLFSTILLKKNNVLTKT